MRFWKFAFLDASDRVYQVNAIAHFRLVKMFLQNVDGRLACSEQLGFGLEQIVHCCGAIWRCELEDPVGWKTRAAQRDGTPYSPFLVRQFAEMRRQHLYSTTGKERSW